MSSAAEAPPSGTRQRLDHVDAMRPIKQSAVISTHALIYFSPLSTSLLASGMLTLTHFSRDAFFFVSACMLTYSYRERTSVPLVQYWKRRFMAVGLVYLVWTLIYWPVANSQNSSSFPYLRVPWSALFSHAGLHNLLFNVATGYYHLYFLLVLLEFYVIFPLVFWLIRRYPKSHLYVVFGALIWQFFFTYLVRRGWLGFVMPSKIETRLVFSYPLYLLGGVVVAFYLESFHDWVVRHWRALIALTVVAGAIPIVIDYIADHTHGFPTIVVPGGDPFAAAVLPYDVGAIVAVYLLGVYLVSPQRSPRTRSIIASGSEAAYGIYVSQLIWILLLHRWVQKLNLNKNVPWLVITIFAVIFTYLVGWLFSALAARTPFARGLVGRGQQPWSTLIPRRRFEDDSPERDFGEGPLNLTDA
jgi:peptidoglycan/LPS O-acetylase OafA/YrhL